MNKAATLSSAAAVELVRDSVFEPRLAPVVSVAVTARVVVAPALFDYRSLRHGLPEQIGWRRFFGWQGHLYLDSHRRRGVAAAPSVGAALLVPLWQRHRYAEHILLGAGLQYAGYFLNRGLGEVRAEPLGVPLSVAARFGLFTRVNNHHWLQVAASAEPFIDVLSGRRYIQFRGRALLHITLSGDVTLPGDRDASLALVARAEYVRSSLSFRGNGPFEGSTVHVGLAVR